MTSTHPIALVVTIACAGYAVSLESNGERTVAIARDESGKTWQACGNDAHAALCELAGQVGLDLADG